MLIVDCQKWDLWISGARVLLGKSPVAACDEIQQRGHQLAKAVVRKYFLESRLFINWTNTMRELLEIPSLRGTPITSTGVKF